MPERQEDSKLTEWLNGDISDTEFKESAGEDALAYKQILNEIDSWVPDNDQVIFDPKKVTSRRKETKSLKIIGWRQLSVAASVLLIAIAGIWYITSPETLSYTAEIGESKRISLPDGTSTITLFSGSTVSWSEDDWSDQARALNLEGTGFLDVDSGSPFTVGTTNGSVEVLGTKFEVIQFNNSLQVNCYEGRVRATSSSGSAIVLSRGEASLFYNGGWEETKALSENSPSWISANESKFEDAPLIQVLNTIEAVFGVKIESVSINLDRRFTGVFPHDDLELALGIVTGPYGISFEITDDIVILTE